LQSHITRPLRRRALLGAIATLIASRGTGARAAADAHSPADALQVLHWWTSAGERAAAAALASRLAQEHVRWIDAAVPGGAGQGAGKVLKGRVLAGDAPEVTQIIGVSIQEWAAMGLLLELDDVSEAENWRASLFPTVFDLVRHGGHTVAAPLGVHRINTLLCNRAVFSRLALSPPATWGEFERVLARCESAGVPALVQSAEPWQVATLFEALLLATGGPALHRALFSAHDEEALRDPRFFTALARLRACRRAIAAPARELSWVEAVRQFGSGQGAMLVTGDWARAELAQQGARLSVDFDCLPFPGSSAWHLYSVDTLTMIAGDFSHAAAQRTLARLCGSKGMQEAWNAAKGSVSVRRDMDPARMDSAARASWTAFARGPGAQAPSLVHRMATDEASKDAIIAELHRFHGDESLAPAGLALRLGAIFRALARAPQQG
jgi:glucose/mannose transport system substrate-binding protein